LNPIILFIVFLVAGKRSNTQINAEKNETQNLPEPNNFISADGRAVSGLPNSDCNYEVVLYYFPFFYF
jgi:hypothetical protein